MKREVVAEHADVPPERGNAEIDLSLRSWIAPRAIAGEIAIDRIRLAAQHQTTGVSHCLRDVASSGPKRGRHDRARIEPQARVRRRIVEGDFEFLRPGHADAKVR